MNSREADEVSIFAEESYTVTKSVNRHGSVFAVCEAWRRNGVYHRVEGPAYIERDPATLLPVHQEWWVEGKRTDLLPRPNGAARMPPCLANECG